MNKRISGGRGTSRPRAPVSEAGYYRINEGTDGDFDWGPKNPGKDPPASQLELAEKVRSIYSWAVDNIGDDDRYREIVNRLKLILSSGAVQNVTDPNAHATLDALEKEVMGEADAMLDQLAKNLTVWFLVFAGAAGLIAAVTSLAGLIMPARLEEPALQACNWALLIAAAAAASAVATYSGRLPVKNLESFSIEKKRYADPALRPLIQLVLVVGIAVIIQGQWISLIIAKHVIDPAHNAFEAFGLGFILGFIGERLPEHFSAFTDRVRKLLGHSRS